MQIFLSHTTDDKHIVEAIGSFLSGRGMTVWIGSWRMTVGDSLVAKIGEGIEQSNRLVVCLTPNSVESNWVKKEVATGLIMELAEDEGFGEKFVVLALLVPCKVPIMLRDKLYANFTNKDFHSGCFTSESILEQAIHLWWNGLRHRVTQMCHSTPVAFLRKARLAKNRQYTHENSLGWE